jgi:hypothetical protein
MNSSCDSWTHARLDDYAERGEIVLRWRLLPASSSSAVAELLNEEVDRIDGLWGFYMNKAPVCMTYNVNVPAGIGHHSEGRLVGIALQEDTLQEINDVITTRQQNGVRGGSIITLSKPPIAVFVQVSLVHNQASHVPTSGFLPRREAREPPVISMPQGTTLADRNVSAKKVRVSLGDMPSIASLDPALTSGSIAGRRRRTQQLTVDVIGTGYRMNFASTVHGLQGATVRGKLIADLNPNPAQRSSITVSGAYVTLSRVQTFEDIRVVPWQNGYSHLQALEHSPDYVMWEQCYDADGHFDIQRLQRNDTVRRRGDAISGDASIRNAAAIPQPMLTARTESGAVARATPTTPTTAVDIPQPMLTARTESGAVARATPTTPRTPRHVSFRPLHHSFQIPALTGLSRNRSCNATGRTQSSLRTPGNLSATATVAPAPTVSPSQPLHTSQGSGGGTQSSSRVNESSSLRSAAMITYSKAYVPFLLQVFYPARRATGNQGHVIDAINGVLDQDVMRETLNTDNFNWNALVEQVRGHLIDMLGQETFDWIRATLVPPDEYIEAIPQEILLGNLFRADELSLQSGFRVVADRIQQSIDNRGDGRNPLLDISILLDAACQSLPSSLFR